MIVCIVTFKLQKPWSVKQAATVFKSTAPRYLGKDGLIRKHYYVSESGDRAGGIYLWETKAHAQQCYTPEWVATLTDKYGSAPDFFYAHVPVTVDNESEEIEVDAGH